MCILLVTSSHPLYPLVLVSNRDEFLGRKSKLADWWDNPPESNVLAGRDLQHPSHGTWLGITKQGRVAILTNYRDEYSRADAEQTQVRSRGEIPKSFLTFKPGGRGNDVDEWARKFLSDEGFKGNVVGGFSFAFAKLRSPNVPVTNGSNIPRNIDYKPFRIISNRTDGEDGIEKVERDTWGLSNTHYSDRSWSKVILGEELLRKAVEEDCLRYAQQEDESKAAGRKDAFIECLFAILDVDRMPEKDPGQDWRDYAYNMRNSIFIPAAGGDRASVEADTAPAGGFYGTQKQTIILVDPSGNATFVEKTLYDHSKQRLPHGQGIRRFDFHIDGWDEEE